MRPTRPGDRLGDAALLGLGAGVRARDVDEGHDRQPAALGELHDPHRLAVALGVRHAEVAADVLLGVGALLLADDRDPVAADGREPRDDRLVVAEHPVAVELDELVGDDGEQLERARPAQVARELDARPDAAFGSSGGSAGAGSRPSARPRAAARPRPRMRSTTDGLQRARTEVAEELGELAPQVGPRARPGRRTRGGTGTPTRWKPGGSSWPIVPAPTRAPANPISALGSARLTSPIAA